MSATGHKLASKPRRKAKLRAGDARVPAFAEGRFRTLPARRSDGPTQGQAQLPRPRTLARGSDAPPLVRKKSRRRGNRRTTSAGPQVAAQSKRLHKFGAGVLAVVVSRAARRVYFLAIIVGVVMAGYVGYQWLLSSPRFAVSEVHVEGVTRTDQDRLSAVLDKYRGQNIFRLPIADMERELTQLSWVASAGVERDYPAGLQVKVSEYRATAVVSLDSLYLATAEGLLFKRAEIADAIGLPVISGLSRGDYEAAPQLGAEKIVDALEVLRTFEEDKTRPPIGEIEVASTNGYTLWTRERPFAIRLGRVASAGILQQRLDAFDHVYKALTTSERDSLAAIYTEHADGASHVIVRFAGDRNRKS